MLFQIILLTALADHKTSLTLDGVVYPTWAIVLGWLMVVFVMLPIPLWAVYELRRADGDTWREVNLAKLKLRISCFT